MAPGHHHAVLAGVPDNPGGRSSGLLAQMLKLSPPHRQEKKRKGLSPESYSHRTAVRPWPLAPAALVPASLPGQGAEGCVLPGCSGRAQRAGRKAPPTLATRTTATPGLPGRQRGTLPAPGSSESGTPPRAAPWGPPDGPPARPATGTGNSRQGCQEWGRGLQPRPAAGGAQGSRTGASRPSPPRGTGLVRIQAHLRGNG